MKYTGYIRRTAYNGYITVDVWDRDDDMYPVLFHQKFEGYTLPEIKRIIRDKLGVKRMAWEVC